MALSALTKNLLRLFFVFVVYLTLGMLLFVAVERDVDLDGSINAEQLRASKILKVNTMSKYNMTSAAFDDLSQKIRDTPKAYSDSNEWSYADGMNFVVQVVTTIGYGDRTPRTTLGQVLCIFYSLFGIPLAVLFLQAIGEEILKGQLALLMKWKGGSDEPSYQHEKCALSSFLFLIVLMFIGAGIQMQVDDWSFVEGVYCYFITFTTIGFGDLIPGLKYTAMRIIHPFFIILGLVAMSNFINALSGCNQSVKDLKRVCRCGRTVARPVQADVTMDVKNTSSTGNVDGV